ncbi:hypothetical protein Vadar_031417 [Vaccinium darrowii]|uniref:Uncharacterized protein n=1 Tax=Vaccinium darrowii TaxID=229202 RepID=A0ACB7Z0U5_9ERIC|nr:hypothetical protein Vadar_031417 [Vaccinium darrowii]
MLPDRLWYYELQDSRFTQQELSACKPILSHGWLITTFVSIGIIFIPIGLASLFALKQVHIFSRKARTETNL